MKDETLLLKGMHMKKGLKKKNQKEIEAIKRFFCQLCGATIKLLTVFLYLLQVTDKKIKEDC